jgi:hypothetical protein
MSGGRTNWLELGRQWPQQIVRLCCRVLMEEKESARNSVRIYMWGSCKGLWLIAQYSVKFSEVVWQILFLIKTMFLVRTNEIHSRIEMRTQRGHIRLFTVLLRVWIIGAICTVLHLRAAVSSGWYHTEIGSDEWKDSVSRNIVEWVAGNYWGSGSRWNEMKEIEGLMKWNVGEAEK